MLKNVKVEKFGLRKNKIYGVCGVVLASMLFVGANQSSVSADETTNSVATVSSESSSLSNVSSVTVSDDSKTSMVVVPESSDLSNAISSVKNAGGTVTQTDTIDKGSSSSSEGSLSKEKEILDDYKTQADKINSTVSDYSSRLSEYNKSITTASSSNVSGDTSKGIYLVGDVDSSSTGSVEFYKNLSVVVDKDKSNITDKDILAKSTLDKSSTVTGDSVSVFSGDSSNSNWSDYAKKTGLFLISNVKDGSTFEIKDFSKTVSGEDLTAKVTINNVVYRTDYSSSNAEILLSPVESGGIELTYGGIKYLDLTIKWYDSTGVERKLLQSYVVGDVDYSEAVGVSYSDSSSSLALANFDGSELAIENGKVVSKVDTGKDYYNSTPKGTFVTTGYGNVTYGIDGTITNAWTTKGKQGTFSSVLFSQAGGIKIVSKPDTLKSTYHLDSYSKSGDVTVNVVVDGKVVSTKTVTGKTGSSYDTTRTTDNVTKIDGKTYKIVKVDGDTTGKISNGSTVVTYTLEEVKTSVTVKYVDEKGNKVADDVVDLSNISTGVGYDTTDHKPSTIIKDGIKYNLVPSKTIGSETGKTTESDIEVTYVYHMPTTEWVEQVNGKTVKVLKEKTDGTLEHGSFDGYDFVSTREDSETGDLVHIFEQKKIPTEPVEPSNNVETPTPTPRPMSMSRVEKNHVSLPETGQKSNVGLSVAGAIIGLLGFVGFKKKKEKE